jgi:hypothetical protein
MKDRGWKFCGVGNEVHPQSSILDLPARQQSRAETHHQALQQKQLPRKDRMRSKKRGENL